MWTSVAIAVVLAISALATVGAQAQGRGQAPAYKPAPGAKDLWSVLFNWTWPWVLRGADEHKLIATTNIREKARSRWTGSRAS
jgi:hypothetical protein